MNKEDHDNFLSAEEREAMETGDPIVIALGHDLVAWISPEDAEIAGMKWRLHQTKKAGSPQYYAICRTRFNNIDNMYWLHQYVWERMTGQPIHSDYLVDHWNQDKLDNRRCNLRAATRTQNEANKQKRRSHRRKDGSTTPYSKYKGVTYCKDRPRPWRALISNLVNGKTKIMHIGMFDTEWEAAEAYNKRAYELFGGFAYVNKRDLDTADVDTGDSDSSEEGSGEV